MFSCPTLEDLRVVVEFVSRELVELPRHGFSSEVEDGDYTRLRLLSLI